MNFTQFLNRNVKILARWFYSPSLTDVAWLEDAQLIFLIWFVCKFGWADKRLEAVRGKKRLQTNVWKIKKISSATYKKATSFKLGEYSLLPSILTFWFRNCQIFNFGRSYLLSDSHTNTVISDHFAYPSKWRRKRLFRKKRSAESKQKLKKKI